MPAKPGIPTQALLVCESFSHRLSASQVAEHVASGLIAAGAPEPDVIDLPGEQAHVETVSLLAEAEFDRRMRAARAVVLCVAALRESTLAGSAAFEVATRARQSGVPCYAITAERELDAFDLRILDLQVVLEARGPATLKSAGERLAAVI